MQKIFVFVILVCFILSSCKQRLDNQSNVIIDSLQYYSYLETKDEKIYYRFPSSEEIFDLINQSGLEYRPELVNNVENVDKYDDSRMQAINLGIYTADLAYLTVFEKTNESIEYFEVLHTLSTKLHITSSINDDLFEKLERNLNNIDSLKSLAKDSYNSIVDHFSITENEKTLAIITAGSYIECLFITCELIKEYSKSNKAISKLAEQKYAMQNLFNYIKNYEEYPYVKQTIKEIQPVFDLYESLSETEIEESSVYQNDDGSLVFVGGKAISMNMEQFEKLKNELTIIRSKYILP